jgi:hypothetical protein
MYVEADQIESLGNRHSSVGIATGYRLEDTVVGVSDMVKNFFLSTLSRPVLWPNQPPMHWVPGVLSLG